MTQPHSLAAEIFAELQQQPAPHPSVAEKPVPQSQPSTALIATVPLTAFCIDPNPPRHYLPGDLRAGVAQHALPATAAIAQLVARVMQGDVEAIGYLEDIRQLATSIAAVGLLYPLRIIRRAHRDGHIDIVIVDGERRYWALLYLAHQRQQADMLVPIIETEADTVNSDDIRRVQWASNLQREDIPAIDYAEAVQRIREACLTRVTTQRAKCLRELGEREDEPDLTEVNIANLLAQREVERVTGKGLSRAGLYRALYIAEYLSLPARAIARAHRVSANRLYSIARRPAEQQVQEVLHAAIREREIRLPLPAAAVADSAGAGRPPTLKRSENLCLSLVGLLRHISTRHLAKASPDDKRALLSHLEELATEIDQSMKSLRAGLNQSQSQSQSQSQG